MRGFQGLEVPPVETFLSLLNALQFGEKLDTYDASQNASGNGNLRHWVTHHWTETSSGGNLIYIRDGVFLLLNEDNIQQKIL